MKTQILVLRPSHRSECCFSITYSHHSTQFKTIHKKGQGSGGQSRVAKSHFGSVSVLWFPHRQHGLFAPTSVGLMCGLYEESSQNRVWLSRRAISMFAGASYLLVLVSTWLLWVRLADEDQWCEVRSPFLRSSALGSSTCPRPGPPFWAPCEQHAPEEAPNPHGHEAPQSIVRRLSSLYWPHGKHIPGKSIKLCFMPVEKACSRVNRFLVSTFSLKHSMWSFLGWLLDMKL